MYQTKNAEKAETPGFFCIHIFLPPSSQGDSSCQGKCPQDKGVPVLGEKGWVLQSKTRMRWKSKNKIKLKKHKTAFSTPHHRLQLYLSSKK